MTSISCWLVTYSDFQLWYSDVCLTNGPLVFNTLTIFQIFFLHQDRQLNGEFLCCTRHWEILPPWHQVAMMRFMHHPGYMVAHSAIFCRRFVPFSNFCLSWKIGHSCTVRVYHESVGVNSFEFRPWCSNRWAWCRGSACQNHDVFFPKTPGATRRGVVRPMMGMQRAPAKGRSSSSDSRKLNSPVFGWGSNKPWVETWYLNSWVRFLQPHLLRKKSNKSNGSTLLGDFLLTETKVTAAAAPMNRVNCQEVEDGGKTAI